MTIKRFIETLPITMLLATAVTAYCSSLGWYPSLYNYLGDIMGYSILTNMVFLFLFWRKQFCIPTKVSVLGLLFMNLVSIAFRVDYQITGVYKFDPLYDVYITIMVILVVAFYKYKRF